PVAVIPGARATDECGRVGFKMAGLPREDFPSLPEGKATKGIKIPADALRALISRTAFAITAEDARYYLSGALLLLERESVSMVATDGHRLAFAQRKAGLKVAEPLRVCEPRKAIGGLAMLLETEEGLTLQPVESHLVFMVGGRTLTSKLVDAQFPAFEKVIAASGDKTVHLAREPLLSAIRRVSLLSSE